MIGHGSPTEEALHARTRCDRAFFIRDRSESFSSIDVSFCAAISRVSRQAFLASRPSNPLISSSVNPRVCALLMNRTRFTVSNE
jgi:hypothetical protein